MNEPSPVHDYDRIVADWMGQADSRQEQVRPEERLGYMRTGMESALRESGLNDEHLSLEMSRFDAAAARYLGIGPVTEAPHTSGTEYAKTSEGWEWIIRLPLSLFLAMVSFLLLAHYEGEAYWLLLAIHTAIAVLIGVIVVRIFSPRIFLFADEALGRTFMYLALFGLAHVGNVGQWMGAPILPILAPVSQHIIAWQNDLTGATVQAPLATHSMSDPLDWVHRLKRRFSYMMADDGGWDSRPMPVNEVLAKLQTPQLIVRSNGNSLLAELTVLNGANVEIEQVSATVEVGSVVLGRLDFVADTPLLPGLEAPLLAALSEGLAQQAVRHTPGAQPVWVSEDLRVRIEAAVTRPFDRKQHFERNLDAWLDD